jgi:hypothetical protein
VENDSPGFGEPRELRGNRRNGLCGRHGTVERGIPFLVARQGVSEVMIKERVLLPGDEAAMNVPDISRVDLPAALVAERCCLVIPSNLDWIEPTIEWLRQRSIQCGVCNEITSGKVVLALTEALVNAIVHGNLGMSSKLNEDD